jgi:hypothetical protein
MKLFKLMLTGAVVVFASAAWAQNDSTATPAAPAAPAAQAGSNDAIVKMRQEEAAANRAYDKKVAAAKKVYDHKKAEAKKERDAAIAAARYGTNQ